MLSKPLTRLVQIASAFLAVTVPGMQPALPHHLDLVLRRPVSAPRTSFLSRVFAFSSGSGGFSSSSGPPESVAQWKETPGAT